ncbi:MULTISPECIES: hypothetical protein [unclassified Streptomyces]|uniref:hypothetical protein n=1 Tax=unclassified Streptomyces TaxID=2593676 RepID=UPI001F38D9C5|nr:MULTISPECIES: hypothetical protein [unclassified Streptomyces]
MSIRAHFTSATGIPRTEPGRHVLSTPACGDTARLAFTDRGSPDPSAPMAAAGTGEPYREVRTVHGRPARPCATNPRSREPRLPDVDLRSR